jgi:hypothetical protein
MVDAVDLSEGWYVHVSVSDDEGGALLAAAAGIVDERGASLVGSPDSDLKELLLFSREDEAERARDAVIDVYQRLRRVAGLDAEPARVVALARPSGKGKSRHRLDVMLMREAKRVLNSSRISNGSSCSPRRPARCIYATSSTVEPRSWAMPRSA